MTRKSRRGRGKRLSRKRRGRQGLAAIAVQRQETAQIEKPISQPPAPVTSESVPAKTPVQIEYPYMAGELRRIGILAGAMLIILVVLALIFA